MRPRVARRFAMVILAAACAAGTARARTLDWADDPASSKDPAFAASRLICRGLRGVAPPAADAPTPAEAASLADCSSEALLFGIGVPADPRAARLCAHVEKTNADPQVTDFGFTGDRTLMTLYADGLGVARNLDIATALACRAGGAPAEIDARVRHLARLKGENWTGTDFSLCDDAATGLMRGICADHGQLVARSDRARAFAALSASWSAADRAAFAPLKRAEAALVDARGQDESDPSGADREAVAVRTEEEQERAFAALLDDAEAGRIAPAGGADARAAESALDAASRALAAHTPTPARARRPTQASAITPEGLAAAERAWLRYRDAWLAFAKVRYPALASDALLARLARERAAQVSGIVTSGD
jgi:hypothetical protein